MYFRILSLSKYIFHSSLLQVRPCSGLWECHSQQNTVPALMEVTFKIKYPSIVSYFRTWKMTLKNNNKRRWQKLYQTRFVLTSFIFIYWSYCLFMLIYTHVCILIQKSVDGNFKNEAVSTHLYISFPKWKIKKRKMGFSF